MALIIFDFDGVLADTFNDFLQFGQEACDELGVKHIVKEKDIRNLDPMTFPSLGRACEVPEQHVNEFVRIILQRIAEMKTPPELFKGMDNIIRRFAANNPVAIVTTNSSQNVNAFLSEHGLAGCVKAVYGVDTPGSKAQKISQARDKFSGEPKQEPVFMVGDSLSDIRAAKEASVTSIAVAWGHQSMEHLLRGDPNHVVNFPEDLIGVIEKQED